MPWAEFIKKQSSRGMNERDFVVLRKKQILWFACCDAVLEWMFDSTSRTSCAVKTPIVRMAGNSKSKVLLACASNSDWVT